jgi:hypothetical protein
MGSDQLHWSVKGKNPPWVDTELSHQYACRRVGDRLKYSPVTFPLKIQSGDIEKKNGKKVSESEEIPCSPHMSSITFTEIYIFCALLLEATPFPSRKQDGAHFFSCDQCFEWSFYSSVYRLRYLQNDRGIGVKF